VPSVIITGCARSISNGFTQVTLMRGLFCPDALQSKGAHHMIFRQIVQASETASPDFTLEKDGSIVLLWPNTLEASMWLRETAPDDAQFFGAALAIEPRYLSNVAEAAISDGFTVQER